MAKTYENSQGQVFNTQVEAAASNTALGTNPKTNNINMGAISVAGLGENVNPVKLPPQKVNLPSEVNLPEITTETQKEVERIKKEKSTQESGISDLIKSLGIEQGKEAQYITEEGGDIAQKEYDKYASDLEIEKQALRRATEKLQKENPQGLFGGGLQQEINRLERESLSKQADIAILGNAAKGRYDTARDIAKRKVESAVAPLKAELEAKKFVYENNSELFSKAELSKLDSLIKADEKKIEREEKLQTSIETIKLEAVKNGLKDLSVFKDVKTLDEALEVGGAYLSTPTTDIVKLENGNTLLIDKKTGKTIKNFGGGSDGGGNLPTGTSEELKGLVSIGSLVGNFSSVNAQKMFLKNLEDLAKKGDEKGLAEKIIGQALANVPDSDTRKRVSNGFNIAKELTRIGTLLNEFEAKGGKTNIFRGKIQDINQKLGTVGDPELASIGTQILNTLDLLVRARTGAALTESEEAFYKKILPSVGNVGALNDALIDGLKTSLMADVENNLINNITTEGFNMVKGTLPEVFSTSTKDDWLSTFSAENLNKNLQNSDFFNQF